MPMRFRSAITYLYSSRKDASLEAAGLELPGVVVGIATLGVAEGVTVLRRCDLLLLNGTSF